MVLFACDWCNKVKQPDQVWILGYAAETVGVTAARREVTIVSSWDYDRAVHPLAVHFCSDDHKERYMATLFEDVPLREVKTTTVRTTSRPAKKKLRSKRTA